MPKSPQRRKASSTKQADEATMSLLASLVDSSEDGIVSATPTGIITSWNRAAELIYGWTPQDIIGKSASVLMPPDQREEMDVILARIRSGERVEHYETVRVRKDGTLFDASLTVSPIRDSSGLLIGISTIARDITERKRVEEQLHATSQYARSLIEASLDPLVTISPEGKITDVNEATIKVTGVPRDGLIGTDFSDYFTEPQKAREGYQQVFSEGFVTDYPLTIRHRDSRLVDVLYNASVYRDVDGNVLGVFAAARDVTARKRAEQAVQAERQRFNDALEMLPAYVVLLAPDYHVRFANRFFRERYGESHGRRCFEYLFGRTEPCEICETYGVLKTMAPHEWQWTGPDGRDYHVFDFPFPDTDGSTLIMEVGIDITERKRAEEELRRHKEHLEQLVEERTAALENRNTQLLAAERARSELLAILNREISHRVKNNLAMVAGMLQMQIASDQDPHLAVMLQNAIARLYAFASVHDQLTVTGSGEVDVTAAIRGCAEAVRRVFLQGGVTVSVEGDALHYPSSAGANISIVANELITNGIKHGRPDGDGQLHVDVRLARDEGALRLSVWSSGNPVPAGMDLSQQTGLGLSLVQGLVVGQYRGTFTLQPRNGGTLAQVVLDEQRLQDG